MLKCFNAEHRRLAIVGRHNVGKSSIFNWLSRRKASIVSENSGSTRDIITCLIKIIENFFEIMDTGGIDFSSSEISLNTKKLISSISSEVDCFLFVVDAKSGICIKEDLKIARFLIESGKPVIVVANKVDSDTALNNTYEFYKLGFGAPHPVSALQGRGFFELFSNINKIVKKKDVLETEFPMKLHTLSIMGRPNVGKSSLLNKLIGTNRSMVSSIPGTTLDPIDSFFRHNNENFLIIDTAGIRRRKNVCNPIDNISINLSFKSLTRSALVLLVFDASEGLTEQDIRLASLAYSKGKCVILIANKWDLVHESSISKKNFLSVTMKKIPFLSHCLFLFKSSVFDNDFSDIWDSIGRTLDICNKRVNTSELNSWLRNSASSHQSPTYKQREIKIYFVTQISCAPLEFVFICNKPEGVHFSYRRYLSNSLRSHFKLNGVPIVLKFKSKDRSLTK